MYNFCNAQVQVRLRLGEGKEEVRSESQCPYSYSLYFTCRNLTFPILGVCLLKYLCSKEVITRNKRFNYQHKNRTFRNSLNKKVCLQKIKNIIIKWELWKFYSIENLYNTLLKIGFIGELATIHIKREEDWRIWEDQRGFR